MQTLIGPNPGTNSTGISVLFDAARQGRAKMRDRVTRMRRAGTLTPETVADMLALLDDALTGLEETSPARYRAAGARAYLIATTTTTRRNR